MSTASRASRALVLAPVLLLTAAAHAADVTVTLGAGNGFSIRNNTGAIQRLRVDEATGNVSRNGALFVHTTGFNNLFVGPVAGNTGTSGTGFNAAFGANALAGITTGTANSAFGQSALSNNTTGSGNSAFGQAALSGNTTGSDNSAFGEDALASNSGNRNSAFGQFALRSNTTGYNNSAFGEGSLTSNTTGNRNSAFGQDALVLNSTGNGNAAFGFRALWLSTSATQNSAFGFYALRNATGGGNVAVGVSAGINQTTGHDNIYLDNSGAAGESTQIKIGTIGIHTGTMIAGIHGATSSGGIAVLVNSSGTLGTIASSARFKQDVRDMADASDLLLKLRPVTFHYREEAVGAEEAKQTQYGLIAEEVAAVAPELVAPDAEGKPYSVKYHELPALLLNELQEQQRTIAEQREQIAALSGRLARLEQGREGAGGRK